MKDFRFQKFSVKQTESVFRVGTDAVLLSVLSNCSSAKNVLEIGTGTGIISLMIAQRNPNAKILAIDIDENAANLAQENFENSIFSERLEAKYQDFKVFESPEKFDLIISNPPYFEINNSQKDILARQKLELDFMDLTRKSSELLSDKGILSVIIPQTEKFSFIKIAEKFNLCLNRKIEIKGIQTAEPKRAILEFSFIKSETRAENFVIEKSPRNYSDEYLELTKDFHVFSEKSNYKK